MKRTNHRASILAIALGWVFTTLGTGLIPSASAMPQQESGLITCWYSADKKATGADHADAGVQAGGPVKTGQGNDYTWAYTIAAKDGTSCPLDLPAPSQSQASLITCWYNADKKITGADTASPGTQVGGPVKSGQGGDYTWAYTIAAKNGTSCPQAMPLVK